MVIFLLIRLPGNEPRRRVAQRIDRDATVALAAGVERLVAGGRTTTNAILRWHRRRGHREWQSGERRFVGGQPFHVGLAGVRL